MADDAPMVAITPGRVYTHLRWRLSRANAQIANATRYEADETTPRPSGRFADLFFAHDGAECHKWFQYFEVYDRVMERFAGTPVRMLEIGVSRGGSLELWRDYLGPEATIMGVDIDPRCAAESVRIGSQADPGFLRSVVEEMGGVDVVLDDGSHIASHQRASFDALWPLLSDGGVYMVEDLHTAYWLKEGGGYRRPGSFIEVAKGLVDGMHKWYFRAPVPRRARMAQHEVRSVSFFDSIVAIEKGGRRPATGKVGIGGWDCDIPRAAPG